MLYGRVWKAQPLYSRSSRSSEREKGGLYVREEAVYEAAVRGRLILSVPRRLLCRDPMGIV